MRFPRGPITTIPANPVTTSVISGFVKNFIGFHDILSAIGSTNDMNHTVRIIGMTDEEYVACLTGIPKNLTAPSLNIAAKLGWRSIPATDKAKTMLHPNFFAAEYARRNGRK